MWICYHFYICLIYLCDWVLLQKYVYVYMNVYAFVYIYKVGCSILFYLLKQLRSVRKTDWALCKKLRNTNFFHVFFFHETHCIDFFIRISNFCLIVVSSLFMNLIGRIADLKEPYFNGVSVKVDQRDWKKSLRAVLFLQRSLSSLQIPQPQFELVRSSLIWGHKFCL